MKELQLYGIWFALFFSVGRKNTAHMQLGSFFSIDYQKEPKKTALKLGAAMVLLTVVCIVLAKKKGISKQMTPREKKYLYRHMGEQLARLVDEELPDEPSDELFVTALKKITNVKFKSSDEDEIEDTKAIDWNSSVLLYNDLLSHIDMILPLEPPDSKDFSARLASIERITFFSTDNLLSVESVDWKAIKETYRPPAPKDIRA